MVSYRPAAVTAALVCGTAAAFSPAGGPATTAGRHPQFIFPARPAPGGGVPSYRTSRRAGSVLRVTSREQTEITGGSSGSGGRDAPPAIQRHMHLPLVPMPTKRSAGARAADNGGTPSANDRDGASSADAQHADVPSRSIGRPHVAQHRQHTQSRPEAPPSANGGAGAKILNDHLTAAAAAAAAGPEYYSDDVTIGELALQHGHEHHEHLVEDDDDDNDKEDSQRAFVGDDNEEEYDVIIGPGSTLALGRSALTFPSTLLVQGTITGQVECTASRDRDDGGVAAPGSKVRVSSNGSIEGDVLSVETVEVCTEGSIVGNVRCKCLRVAEGGEIVGDVTCGSLFLEPGATVRGVIRCGEASEDDTGTHYPALEAAAEPLVVSEVERNGFNGVNGAAGAGDTSAAQVDPADIYEIGHPVGNGYQVDASRSNDYQVINGQNADSNGIANGHGINGHQKNGHLANGHHQGNGHNGAQQQKNIPDYNANGQHIHVDFDHSLTHSSAPTLDVPKVNGWGALPPVTATRSTSTPAASKVPNFQPQFPYDPSGSKRISIRNGLGMDIDEEGRDSTSASSGSASAASVDDGIFGYLGKSVPQSNGVTVENKQQITAPNPHKTEPLPTTVTRNVDVPRVLDKNGKISTQGTLDAIKEQYERESEDPFYLDDFGNPLYRGANEDEMTTLRNNRDLVDENRRLIENYLRSKQEREKEAEEEEEGECVERSAATRDYSDGDDSHRPPRKSSGGFKKRLSVKASEIDTNGEEDILPHFLKEDRRGRR